MLWGNFIAVASILSGLFGYWEASIVSIPTSETCTTPPSSPVRYESSWRKPIELTESIRDARPQTRVTKMSLKQQAKVS